MTSCWQASLIIPKWEKRQREAGGFLQVSLPELTDSAAAASFPPDTGAREEAARTSSESLLLGASCRM